MEKKNKNFFRRLTDKVFGGINLTWPKVIIAAVIAGVITAVIAIIPQLRYTSFIGITVTFEVWILFGIIIIMNSKSNLDSALKCFVFFLISQSTAGLSDSGAFQRAGLAVVRILQILVYVDAPLLPDGLCRLLDEKRQVVGIPDSPADDRIDSDVLRNLFFGFSLLSASRSLPSLQLE